MSLPDLALVVIAKYPTPGRVKTRLAPAIGPDRAAAVHRCFLRHVVARLRALAPAELVVCFDPPDARAAMADLLADLGPLTLLPQVPGDLGHRLAGAFADVARRHRRALILAVDSPDVPADHLRRAAAVTAEADVSLGLARDGGYWCIGLATDRVDPAALLHADIAWSTDRAAADTLASAARLGHRTATGCPWDDVDEPADLRRLLTRLATSTAPDDRQLLSDLAPIVRDLAS